MTLVVFLSVAIISPIYMMRKHKKPKVVGNLSSPYSPSTECSLSLSLQPLKVFVLAGQSNMAGMGSMEHLTILLNDFKTAAEYAHLWRIGTQSWSERNDVYCKFDNHTGKLSAGYGNPPGHFGPELGFGWVVGDDTCETILLLKTAWGGRDLAVDFRPPRSGQGNYEGVKPAQYGSKYREMISDIFITLDTLSSIIPSYNPGQGFELAGFVWFQGWNDLLEWEKVNEYRYNLANLIRDVRDDLNVPHLPFIVGELGVNGVHPHGDREDALERMMAMRAAQRDVTLMTEFRDDTRFVPTAKYVVMNGTTYDGNYHYFGRADTYYHIGRALGKAMLRLLRKHNPNHFITSSTV